MNAQSGKTNVNNDKPSSASQRIAILEDALREAREIVKRYYDESGPCDHAVNICVCDIARVGERIDDILGGGK